MFSGIMSNPVIEFLFSVSHSLLLLLLVFVVLYCGAHLLAYIDDDNKRIKKVLDKYLKEMIVVLQPHYKDPLVIRERIIAGGSYSNVSGRGIYAKKSTGLLSTEEFFVAIFDLSDLERKPESADFRFNDSRDKQLVENILSRMREELIRLNQSPRKT
ncbi:MAG: hypothetical protein R3B60_00080 [Candidatus Paceibacterota bacterium]